MYLLHIAKGDVLLKNPIVIFDHFGSKNKKERGNVGGTGCEVCRRCLDICVLADGFSYRNASMGIYRNVLEMGRIF
jgi:hypothetical protein